MPVQKDIVECKDKVAYLLKTFPRTRVSDKELWFQYMISFTDLRRRIGHVACNNLLTTLMDPATPALESLSRVRRKFQSVGKYTVLNETQRMTSAHKVRDWATQPPQTEIIDGYKTAGRKTDIVR